jgi:hypothetical protein
MKHFLSIFLFVMTIVLLVGTVVSSVWSIYDTQSYLEEHVNSGSDDSIAYLGVGGVGWLYGSVLFIASIIGIVLSAVSMRLLAWKIPRTVSMISMWLFVLLGVISTFIFYTGVLMVWPGKVDAVWGVAAIVGIVLSAIAASLMKLKKSKTVMIVSAVLVALILLLEIVLF